MKKSGIFIFTLLIANQTMALDCPKTIEVSVKGLKTISSENKLAVEEIFKKGDQQTDQAYIQAVLQSVENIHSLQDTLTIVKNLSGKDFCQYKGTESSLTLRPKNYNHPTAYADLKIGQVSYVGSSPTKAWGSHATLKTPLIEFNASKIQTYKSKKSILEIELLVQVPIGDYGTDGYSVNEKIGSAESVVYTVR